MLFWGELPRVLLLVWSALVWLFMVVSMANVTMVFASGGSADDSCSHVACSVITDCDIVAFHTFVSIYPIPLMHIWTNCVTC